MTCISQGTWRKDWALAFRWQKEIAPVVSDLFSPRMVVVFMAVSSMHALAIAWRSIINALPTQIAQGIEETQPWRKAGKRSFIYLLCTKGCAKLLYTSCLISTLQPMRNRLSYSLCTDKASDSERADGLPEVPQLASARPLFSITVSCSRMGEYLRGCGPLQGCVLKGPHRGGRDEDAEQGGLSGCEELSCRMELRCLSKAAEKGKCGKGSPEPGLLSGNP